MENMFPTKPMKPMKSMKPMEPMKPMKPVKPTEPTAYCIPDRAQQRVSFLLAFAVSGALHCHCGSAIRCTGKPFSATSHR